MNLFFRLVLVFIRASRAKPYISILDESRLKFRVWLTDQDMFMHMTNSRYLSFSDLGTINYIVRSGCWKVLKERGWFPTICAQSMVVSRMMKTPQKFEIATKITGWTDTYVGMSHRFISKGQEHAEVCVIAKFGARDKSKVPPQAMIDARGETLVSPPLSDTYLKLIDDLEEAKRRRRKQSRHSNQ